MRSLFFPLAKIMSKPSHSPKVLSRGFTLLEFLFLLTLVGILAVLSVVAVSQVRHRSQVARDVHQLKAIGQQFHLFVAENNGNLPASKGPGFFKLAALRNGWILSTKDWSNDQATPKNSIFYNNADEASIRAFFQSPSDPRPHPDPLNSYATNASIGFDPYEDPPSAVRVLRLLEIKHPSRKILCLPSSYLNSIDSSFSEAKSRNPFRNDRNPADKGDFPALFVDGHVELVDPDPAKHGLSLSEAIYRWLRPTY